MAWNGTIVDSEILAVHAALVPAGAAGEVVLFGGDEHWWAQAEPAGGFHKTRVYDVASHRIIGTPTPDDDQVLVTSPDSDVFCAHHAFVRDGRLLVAGGTQAWPTNSDGHDHTLDFLGHRRCWLYNHAQRTWVETSPLNTNPEQDGEPHSGGRWYPGLIPDGAGDVLAFFGHLDQQDTRHRNTLPERFVSSANTWVNLAADIGTPGEPNEGGRRYLFFPRGWVMPDGDIFFATPMPAEFSAGNEGPHRSTAFDPATSTYVAPQIPEPRTGSYSGWDRPAVLLPLLPEEGYRMRFAHLGGREPLVLDLGDADPQWRGTANREAALQDRDRRFANAVLLPTGEVAVVGGVADAGEGGGGGVGDRLEDPVLETEIYNPGIDFVAQAFTGPDEWKTKEAGVHTRNYHSCALLLPTGAVLVAGGNTNAQSGNPDDELDFGGVKRQRGIKQIELYEPDYMAVADRINVISSPRAATYGQTITLTLDRAAAGVGYVAVIRNGSATHSTNNDQRFVQLDITARDGDTISVRTPPSGNHAPPGPCMLWVVDTDGRPCVQAPFLRLAHTSCHIVTDRSTFSAEEVAALGGGGTATFTNAVYAVVDGYIHTEVTATPTAELTWADSGLAVDASQVTLVPAGRLQETEPGFADTPQRITFPFHVRFGQAGVFDGFDDRRMIRLRFSVGQERCTVDLELTHSPNPYSIDIDSDENNPAWLSTDVRAFSLAAGQSHLGITQTEGEPIEFIRNCLDTLNGAANGDALFESLSTSAKLDLARRMPFINLGIYNYAIARVRYRASLTIAQRVRCFFRLFNVAATGLQFDPNATYRRTAPDDDTVPLLGLAGDEVVSIPFFASPRIESVGDGSVALTEQALDPTYEIIDIQPDPDGDEVTVFFGAWLDINQPDKRFPLNPADPDGPWSDDSARSIQELIRGEHLCLVAEVFSQDDPTPNGATPGTSDNLAQRNLAVLHSDNPGGVDSRTVMHPFDIAAPRGGRAQGNLLAAFGAKGGPDELLIRWHNLPRDAEAFLHFSDVDQRDLAPGASRRFSPPAYSHPTPRTLAVPVGGATWVPLPDRRDTNIPALLELRLPEGVRDGERYRVSVHQVEGRRRRIIGSCDFAVEVGRAETLIGPAARTLSVLRHIHTTMSETERWYPLFTQYLHHLGVKLGALGGDPGSIEPSPDGTGVSDGHSRPGPDQRHPDDQDHDGHGGPGGKVQIRGLVEGLHYDCHGRFEAFTIDDCQRLVRIETCSRGIERVVRRACKDVLEVVVSLADHNITGIETVCS